MANKKKKAAKPPREFTRRQLSQWQRQRRRQRITFMAGVSIIIAIILIVLTGYYLTEYRPLHQTVIRVNDTKFNMAYYLDGLAAYTTNGQDYQNFIANVEGVKYGIEQAELVRLAALALGFSASDEEATTYLQNINLAVNDTTIDLAREQALLGKLRTSYFDDQVPESMPQAHVMAMLLESESQARELRSRVASSENFTELAAAFSLRSDVEDNQGDFGWHPENILSLTLGSQQPVDYAFGAEAGALSQPIHDEEQSKPVGYWLARVLIRDVEDEAQAQGILLGSEEEALEIKARLEAGEELAPLAEEFSQDDTSQKQGGELGVVSKDEVSLALDEYLFNPETELDQWSDPIRDDTITTTGAYWLVKVVDRDDDRPLDSQDRNYLLNVAINEWITSLLSNPAYVIDDSTLDSEREQWAAERLAAKAE